jgi:hypothetical protein
MKAEPKLEQFLKTFFLVTLGIGFVCISFDIVSGATLGGSIHPIIVISFTLDYVIYLFLLFGKRHKTVLNISNSSISNNGLVTLISLSDGMEAEIVKQLLSSRGIKAILRREIGGSFGTGLNALAKSFLGQSTVPGSIVNVYVKEADFTEAKKIIEQSLNSNARRQ